MFGSRNKSKQEILQNYKRTKNTTFDFERIALFFSNSDLTDAHQVLPYSTLQDLDFEELFMRMDRTCSRIGQQYFYYTLRTIPKKKDRALHHEEIINYLDENPEIKKASVLALSRLDKPGAYFLQSLIFGTNIIKPNWFWVIPLLSGLSVASLFLSFIAPAFAVIFASVLIVNFIIHYWNKKNILTYSNSIPQLLILNQVAKKLIHSGVILSSSSEIQNSNNTISKICRKAVFYKLEEKLNSEMGQFVEYLLELIKATFLVEPILMFKIIGELELKKREISEVFEAVAQVDVAISISSFRASLPFYSLPKITNQKKSLCSKEMYHPLIPDSVANSIDLSDDKSVLISGSNMSGKTTFIRTIGINTILAQTINTACAKEFSIPKLKVHSAIRITDNLLDETSYYYEEVKTIKKMIGASESEHQNLFLLDEIFKGTNTIERVASGKSVLSYLNRKDNLVFASTHEMELTEFLSKEFNYFHFTETIENDALSFDYKLREGKATHTNAIRILEINKFPKAITDEAKILASQLRQSKGTATTSHS